MIANINPAAGNMIIVKASMKNTGNIKKLNPAVIRQDTKSFIVNGSPLDKKPAIPNTRKNNPMIKETPIDLLVSC